VKINNDGTGTQTAMDRDATVPGVRAGRGLGVSALLGGFASLLFDA
jgi:hypothetical protein